MNYRAGFSSASLLTDDNRNTNVRHFDKYLLMLRVKNSATPVFAPFIISFDGY